MVGRVEDGALKTVCSLARVSEIRKIVVYVVDAKDDCMIMEVSGVVSTQKRVEHCLLPRANGNDSERSCRNAAVESRLGE